MEKVRKTFFQENFLIFGIERSLSQSKRNFLEFPSWGFHFLKFFDIRGKTFHFQECGTFLILEQENSISRNIKNLFSVDLFSFFELGNKTALGSPI